MNNTLRGFVSECYRVQPRPCMTFTAEDQVHVLIEFRSCDRAAATVLRSHKFVSPVMPSRWSRVANCRAPFAFFPNKDESFSRQRPLPRMNGIPHTRHLR